MAVLDIRVENLEKEMQRVNQKYDDIHRQYETLEEKMEEVQDDVTESESRITKHIGELSIKLDTVLERTDVLRFTGAPEELNKDMQFLRSMRLKTEENGQSIRRALWITSMTIGVSALLIAIKLWLKDTFNKGG
jgi:predicted  nucleic acid-binding Zn-ribbon protein